MSGTPRILTLDIETSPNLADVWGLFNQNVSLSQLRDTTRVISFAAKWYGERKVEFRSEFHDGHDEMIERAYALLDEADILVGWNSKGFDRKHLMREFLLAGYRPVSPFFDVDLMLTVKRHFRFASNKLDHVSKQLGFPGKVKHDGHNLWVRCLAGDETAWALMRKYNIGDVRLTEDVYTYLRPWITDHPHTGLWEATERSTCSNCGSVHLERRGYAYTKLAVYARFICKDCGRWGRGARRLTGADVRAAA